jgi:hypothetical protein
MAAPKTMIGSGSFLNFQSNPSVTTPISAVGMSMMDRCPNTTTAPAIAPMAATVTPSTNAATPGILPYFLNKGAGITVSKYAGKKSGYCGNGGPGKTSDQVPYKASSDDDRAWRDHGNRYRIDKFLGI